MNSNPIIGCLSIPNPSTHILLSWELNEILLFLQILQYFEFTSLASLFINESSDYSKFAKLAQQRHSQIIFLFYILAKLPQIYLVPTPMPRSKRIIFLPPAFVVVSYSASRLNLKQSSSVRISNE